MPYIKDNTPTDVILTEDGKEVRVGDGVYCYYDGHMGVIERIEDTHMTADERQDPRNQALWADVRCDDGRLRSYNGQRLATTKNGSV